MSTENPTENPRAAFESAEMDVEQTKEAMSEAVKNGDYDKVMELAQKAKELESAKGEMKGEAFDEATQENERIDAEKAAAEKAQREAELAKQAEENAAASKVEADALLNKMQGGNRVEKEEPKEKSPEEKMDEYIAQFKKIGAERGSYNLWFNTMRDDKAVDFDHNDEMVVRFVKGMGNIGAVGVLNGLGKEKQYSKNVIMEIIDSVPASNANDFYRGGYNELRILASRSNLEKDKDVIDAIVRKNPNMASVL